MAQSVEPRRSGRLSVMDKALVGAGVVGGVLVVLWVAHAVLGLVLFAFKVVLLVVVVAVIVRLVHLFSRSRR